MFVCGVCEWGEIAPTCVCGVFVLCVPVCASVVCVCVCVYVVCVCVDVCVEEGSLERVLILTLTPTDAGPGQLN